MAAHESGHTSLGHTACWHRLAGRGVCALHGNCLQISLHTVKSHIQDEALSGDKTLLFHGTGVPLAFYLAEQVRDHCAVD